MWFVELKKLGFIQVQKASGLLNKLTRLKVRILSDLPLANISFKSIK